MIGPTNRKNWLTFGGDLVLGTDSRSLFYFPHQWGIGYFRRFISTSDTVTGDFHDAQRNDLCQQRDESTTYLGVIRQTSEYGVIRKSGFKSRITLLRLYALVEVFCYSAFVVIAVQLVYTLPSWHFYQNMHCIHHSHCHSDEQVFTCYSSNRLSSYHHSRFWYLRCCGCPGLRGRQHLAMPHTRSVYLEMLLSRK